jgi:hypothetical protein
LTAAWYFAQHYGSIGGTWEDTHLSTDNYLMRSTQVGQKKAGQNSHTLSHRFSDSAADWTKAPA